MSGKLTFTSQQVAALFGVETRTIRRWTDRAEDPLPISHRGGKGRGARHQFDPLTVYEWGVRQRLAQVQIDEDGKPLDYTQERAKLARAQRRKVELEAKALSGDLIPADTVITGLERTFAGIRARLLAIPNKTAPRAVAMSEAEVEDFLTSQIHDALLELAASDFPGIGDADAAAEADDKSVGGRESGAKS